jgi:WD40 repeat protein
MNQSRSEYVVAITWREKQISTLLCDRDRLHDDYKVTPDGRHVVSGSDDKTLRVWDLATGETTVTLQGHAGPGNAVAVTPDGRHLVSGFDDQLGQERLIRIRNPGGACTGN